MFSFLKAACGGLYNMVIFMFPTLVHCLPLLPHPCEQAQGMAIDAEQVVGVPEQKSNILF